ncbi:MAG TPA: xanthine dehydrogenase family protein molybdopterin-binding subunit [Acidimicrobiia bacterium]|nr:xanthine dehydrogenase family protein molybdopterin-binding subunit [Acidimicrobiia bacterium]
MLDNLSSERFLYGLGSYLEDLPAADALSAVFVRSPFAHARLLGVDTSEGAAMPGVAAVYTAADLDLLDIPGDLRTPDVPTAMSRPPLVRTVARYAGEPVAIVLAVDRASAVDAAELIDVRMESLPAVVDARAAVETASLLFPEVGTNVAMRVHTRSGEMPSDADVSIELDLFQPRLAPTPIEPFGFLATPRGEVLDIWCSYQMPHRLRRELATCLGVDPETLRIRVPDVGGAFGQKGQLNAEYIVVAAAALKLGRAVRWIQSRRENLTVGAHGRSSRSRIRMHGDQSGRIRGLEVEVLADAGAYPHSSAFVPLSTHLMAPGPYRFDAVDITTTIVTTTSPPTGPYRGAGRPEAAYALERAIEVFARRIGMDVADVRRQNLVRASDMPYTTQTGAIYDGGDYGSALDLLLERMDYPARRRQQREARDRGEAVGIGLAVFLDRTGGSSLTLGEYGSTEVTADGTVVVRTGSTDSGQGHWPIWRRLAAEALDVSAGSVTIVTGDTAEVPDGTGTFGSRSSQVGASSVHRTAIEVQRQALDLASRMLEIDAADLVSDGRGGFTVRGDDTASVTLAELATRAVELGTPLFAEEYFRPGAQTFPHAAHGAIVSVDVDTCAVSLLQYFAVDDCGRMLDPIVVEGQVHGSVVQGIGQALYERFVQDEHGNPLTGSLASYSVPHAIDIPPIATSHTETPAPSNPLGTKGVGESGTIGAPAAIMNAIVDALSPWGVTDIAFPANPMNVWAAMRGADSV